MIETPIKNVASKNAMIVSEVIFCNRTDLTLTLAFELNLF